MMVTGFPGRSASLHGMEARPGPGFHAKNSLLTIDSHVIDDHFLRELGRLVRIAGPISPNGKVQDHEEWMVIDPFCVRRQIVRTSRRVKMVIHIEANLLRLPFNSKSMELIVETPVDRQSERRANTMRSRIARPVDRPMNHRWFASNIFDDIDLPASRPSDC